MKLEIKGIAEQFLAGAKARSDENVAAFECLYSRQHYGVCIGLMRQELDTLLRLAFLWRPETDKEVAVSLMDKTIKTGERWSYKESGKRKVVSDKDMVDFAHFLGGWERVVYSFGCKAIHLSNLHSYHLSDPVENLTSDEKAEIGMYLKSYHGFDQRNLTIDILIAYLPKVMEKIKGNVDFYLEEMEERYMLGS